MYAQSLVFSKGAQVPPAPWTLRVRRMSTVRQSQRNGFSFISGNRSIYSKIFGELPTEISTLGYKASKTTALAPSIR